MRRETDAEMECVMIELAPLVQSHRDSRRLDLLAATIMRIGLVVDPRVGEGA